jgi:hypothetical protein
MATTRRLAQLFRAIASEDLVRAAEVAETICAETERAGHRNAARDLRGVLASTQGGASKRVDSGRATGDNAPQSLISNGLTRLTVERGLVELELSHKSRTTLNEVIVEWKNASLLQRHGLSPRSKLIFHGPPGCGKSITAQALGRELDLPVYMIRFDAVIGAFLGQTAMHLRQLFHFVESTPCVLLIDEIDALGKKRGNPLDVGELDRIVISLLQELEHSRPRGLVVATTNLPKNLDEALWRRFDLDVAFPIPSASTLRAFAKSVADRHKMSLNLVTLRRAESAKSFSAAEQLVVSQVRRHILAASND